MDVFADLLKLVVPAGLVLYGMYMAVRLMLERDTEKQRLETKHRYSNEIIPLRLQAYERIALLLERISPNNLLLRLNGQAPTALDFHQLLLHEIREEYNHNLSQQIYMSQEVWDQVQAALNEVISLINQAAGEIAPDAPAIDLSKKIFDKIIQLNAQPTGPALRAVKEEVQTTFL